jgi:hypothetical protein
LDTGWHHIVFERVIGPIDPDGNAASAVLWTARRDGTHVRRLSESGIDGTYEDDHARFAPTGGYLTFTRLRDSDLATADFRMSRGGTDVRQLTPWNVGADYADISPARQGPTKNLLVFEAGNGDLGAVPADCPDWTPVRRRSRC